MLVIKGKSLWSKVFEPDTKFIEDGEYSTQVIVSEADAAQVCEQLEALIDEEFNKIVKDKPALKATLSKRPVTEPDIDQDGNATGNVVFKSKLKAKIRSKTGAVYNQKPNVVDAKRNPMTGIQLVGNGSLVKIAVEPITYYMPSSKQVGVSLRLKAMQVIDLVEHGVPSADSLFDDEEGFVAKAIAKDTPTTDFDDVDTEGKASDEGDF
tara:strand:- start:17365 stop:17991 length:627 start_codon:yes stop_codon:yes gene_type:complete